MQTFREKTALVTGASSGLGRDFATQLARRGCNLVIVARRVDRLQELAGELTERYGVSVEIIPTDLGADDGPQQLYDRVHALGLRVDVLINNAGLGLHGEFVSIPWEQQRALLSIDVLAVVHLTKLFLADMVARHSGNVMLIASTMAYQSAPSYATYAAAKAFVLQFGEGISYELRRTGVSVTVVSPGMMLTEFHDVAGQKPSLLQRATSMPSAKVAHLCLDAMARGKPRMTPGRLNGMMTFSSRLLPTRVAAMMAGTLLKSGGRSE